MYPVRFQNGRKKTGCDRSKNESIIIIEEIQRPAGKAAGLFLYNKEKNIYAVTLNYMVTTDKNYSCFTISDYIPSGARWYPANNSTYSHEKEGSWSHSAYVDILTGQSVRGNIHVYHNNSNKLAGLEEVTLSGSVTYYIRGAVEGVFAVDYAVLRDRSTGRYAISESGTVNINDGEWKIVLKK